MDDPHALAASTGAGLDHDREADLGSQPFRFVEVGHLAVRAGHQWHVLSGDRFLGRQFVAHRADAVRAGTDEGEPGLFDGFGEFGVFTQEAIPRMDGVRSGDFGGFQDAVKHEIALGGRGGAYQDGFVRIAGKRHGAVHLGMDGDAGDAHGAKGAHHPKGDFPAVGDQDLGDGPGRCRFVAHAVKGGAWAADSRIRGGTGLR